MFSSDKRSVELEPGEFQFTEVMLASWKMFQLASKNLFDFITCVATNNTAIDTTSQFSICVYSNHQNTSNDTHIYDVIKFCLLLCSVCVWTKHDVMCCFFSQRERERERERESLRTRQQAKSVPTKLI